MVCRGRGAAWSTLVDPSCNMHQIEEWGSWHDRTRGELGEWLPRTWCTALWSKFEWGSRREEEVLDIGILVRMMGLVKWCWVKAEGYCRYLLCAGNQGRHLRGLGGRRPKEKRKEKKEEKKKGTMNNVKLLHIKCCFFQFFNSPVALKKI